MIRNTYKQRDGFTLVEIMAAATILLIVVSMSLTGFIHVLKGSNEAFVQDELDVDVQKAMEYLKRDLRLTSVDEMHFYPPGESDNRAVSFPLGSDEHGATPADDPDGAWDLNPATSNIDWNVQVVYHVYEGDPHQFRKTLFYPRDDTLTAAQRRQQVKFVYTNGSAVLKNSFGVITGGTYNYTNANTRVIFENLFRWDIREHASTYDLYSEETNRSVNVDLGGIVLTPGAHRFTFSVYGKDPDSSGYKLAVDSLYCSPSESDREAEFQLPAVSNVGAVASTQYMSSGAWDANYQLMFPATDSNDQFFTLMMSNDVWEDVNFLNTGYETDNSDVSFDSTLDPKTFVVEVDGATSDFWWAQTQAGATNGLGGNKDTVGDSLRDTCVRVVMKGSDMMSGGFIKRDAGQMVIHLANGGDSAGDQLWIDDIYVAELASFTNMTPNIDISTQRRFAQWGVHSRPYSIGYAESIRFVAEDDYFMIDENKSYAITFQVSSMANKGNAAWWPDSSDADGIGCYVVTNAAGGETAMANWSGLGTLVETSRLYAVEGVQLYLPSNATYTSGPFDTHKTAPNYTTISWEEEIPTDCGLTMKVRTATNEYMSGAPDWDTLTPLTGPDSFPTGEAGNKRYVQYQATLLANRVPFSGWSYQEGPKLKSVAISWPGPIRYTTIGGTFTTGPDHGILRLSVDGEALKSGVLVDLEIYEDAVGYRGNRSLTSRLVSEVKPRNTGK